MEKITISGKIKEKLPDLMLGILEIKVTTQPTSEELKQKINSRIQELERFLPLKVSVKWKR